jgi:hypothetical protein
VSVLAFALKAFLFLFVSFFFRPSKKIHHLPTTCPAFKTTHGMIAKGVDSLTKEEITISSMTLKRDQQFPSNYSTD